MNWYIYGRFTISTAFGLASIDDIVSEETALTICLHSKTMPLSTPLYQYFVNALHIMKIYVCILSW